MNLVFQTGCAISRKQVSGRDIRAFAAGPSEEHTEEAGGQGGEAGGEQKPQAEVRPAGAAAGRVAGGRAGDRAGVGGRLCSAAIGSCIGQSRSGAPPSWAACRAATPRASRRCTTPSAPATLTWCASWSRRAPTSTRTTRTAGEPWENETMTAA